MVAGLALRELWISLRLFAVLSAFLVAGALVALVPSPHAAMMGRMGVGLGIATVTTAVVAAWSVADERARGRAGWLVGRAVRRRTLVAGWFLALAGAAIVPLMAAGGLAWLAIAGVTLRLDAAGYAAHVVAVAASVLLAITIGVVAGTLLGRRVAALVTVSVCLWLGAVASIGPLDASLVPGGAFAELAGLREPGSFTGGALRNAGVTLMATAATLLVAAAAMDRTDL